MNTLSSTIRYVIKVLQSCKTDEQLDVTTNWAVSVVTIKAQESKKQPVDSRGKSHKRLIPPRVVACLACGGTGLISGFTCDQCGGSGRWSIENSI